MTRTDRHKKAMIEALNKNLGVITLACKEVGICRQTHYDWYKEDEQYRKAVDDVENTALDFAEFRLRMYNVCKLRADKATLEN